MNHPVLFPKLHNTNIDNYEEKNKVIILNNKKEWVRYIKYKECGTILE